MTEARAKWCCDTSKEGLGARAQGGGVVCIYIETSLPPSLWPTQAHQG